MGCCRSQAAAPVIASSSYTARRRSEVRMPLLDEQDAVGVPDGELPEDSTLHEVAPVNDGTVSTLSLLFPRARRRSW